MGLVDFIPTKIFISLPISRFIKSDPASSASYVPFMQLKLLISAGPCAHALMCAEELSAAARTANMSVGQSECKCLILN